MLNIEVTHGRSEIVLARRKYVLNLLNEIGMLGVKLTHTLMEQNVNLNVDDSLVFSHKRRYQNLVGGLIYLIVIRPNITFPRGTISQFMNTPKQIY